MRFRAELAALVLAVPTHVLAGEEPCASGTWWPMPALTIPRQECAAALIGSKVYVVGGLVAPDLGATPTVEVLDLGTRTLSFAPPLPVALHHPAVAAYHETLYVIGGYANGLEIQTSTWILYPRSDAWIEGPALPEPTAAAAAVAGWNSIFVLGGVGPDGVRASTWILSVETRTWRAGPPMPTAREHLAAVPLPGGIHVIGGRNGGSTGAHERLDPWTGQWTVLSPLPTPRSALGVGVVRGGIVAAGGEVPRLFDTVERYDLASGRWECGAAMPIPRHGAATVYTAYGLVLAGGGTIQGYAPTAATHLYAEYAEAAIRTARVRPNPFSARLGLTFSIQRPVRVRIDVIDATGRHVRRIWEVEPQIEPYSSFTGWDGRDEDGRLVPPGLYSIVIRAGDERRVLRVVRLP